MSYKNLDNYYFLFNLDRTLVITGKIYFKVS